MSPFILTTAHDSPRLRAEACRRGAAYLAKPFLGTTLLDAVKAVIGAATPPLCEPPPPGPSKQ